MCTPQVASRSGPAGGKHSLLWGTSRWQLPAGPLSFLAMHSIQGPISHRGALLEAKGTL